MITTLVFTQSDMPGLLLQADPEIAPDRADYFGAPLLETALKYGITTPLRLAHWLAQLLHESGHLRYTEELASGAAYENNKGLGNTKSGDGRRFKGRGLPQLTGRYNYTRYAKVVPEADLLNHPDALAHPPYSVDVAGWFWQRGSGQDLNRIADKDNVTLVTRVINGGLHGLASRKRHLVNAKAAIDEVGARRVQTALNGIGTLPQLVIDGDFGPRTASVVREFQADWLLPVTGDVDLNTWRKLYKDATYWETLRRDV